MKTTGRIFNRGLVVLAACILTAVPFSARGELVADQTTVGGPDAVNLCIREYGRTAAEAFEAGAELVKDADAKLGADRLYGNVRIRVLPEKENGMYVVEIYSHPGKICAVRTDYTTAQL